MNWIRQAVWKLQDRKAQILLPSVFLAPIFILVIYLLFETAKVSMTKVRNQFALDNAAYSQIASVSTYLNAVAMINGPLPYRVMYTYKDPTLQPSDAARELGATEPISVFEVFYHGGGVPTIAPDYETGKNDPPKPEQQDWGVHYDPNIETKDEDSLSRKDWETETPGKPGDKWIPVMSKDLVEKYDLSLFKSATMVVSQYLQTYAYLGEIYNSQTYTFKDLTKNVHMFRNAYYLNVPSGYCKKSECGRQSAAQLRPYMQITTEPFALEKVRFWASDSTDRKGHFGAINLDLKMSETIKTQLFQFAYLTGQSRTRLRSLGHGVRLKQPFKLPRNYFNINLDNKYKPYVRTTIQMSCPRSGNNCVWPNPLPKYGVSLDP